VNSIIKQFITVHGIKKKILVLCVLNKSGRNLNFIEKRREKKLNYKKISEEIIVKKILSLRIRNFYEKVRKICKFME
jgi:hypothetical protein